MAGRRTPSAAGRTWPLGTAPGRWEPRGRPGLVCTHRFGWSWWKKPSCF